MADEDALAGREAVDLDDARRPGHGEDSRGRDTGGGHHLLGKALRALDPGGRRARPEDGDAASAEVVRHARDERRLRPDDDEIDTELPSEREQTLGVLRPDRVAVTEPRDPGVARRGLELFERGALPERPGQRMLAAAGSDDQHLHAAE